MIGSAAMTIWRNLTIVATLLLTMAADCTTPETNLKVEKLPEVTPSLPPVPTIPPHPHPLTYPDSTYSVFGLRYKIRKTIKNDQTVTGYIVDIYVPPECEEDPCPRPKAPHMWVADTKDEKDRAKQVRVVGYAENQEQIDEAIELARKGKLEPPDPESGILPIPTDFLVGNKVKVTGPFNYVSGTGFQSSDGLIEYRKHETLESVAPAE